MTYIVTFEIEAEDRRELDGTIEGIQECCGNPIECLSVTEVS
jgi:hypothetical protein